MSNIALYAEEPHSKYTRGGDAVLDPFAGRFSTTALANYLGRPGCGVEIIPLGWLYGRVKLNPAQRCGEVLRRVQDMWDASVSYRSDAAGMNEFSDVLLRGRAAVFAGVQGPAEVEEVAG